MYDICLKFDGPNYHPLLLSLKADKRFVEKLSLTMVSIKWTIEYFMVLIFHHFLRTDFRMIRCIKKEIEKNHPIRTLPILVFTIFRWCYELN